MNRNYLITGATSSLGKALASRIKYRFPSNCKLFIVSRKYSEKLEQLVNTSDTNIVYRWGRDLDLLHLKQGDAILDEIDTFFGDPFTLIHCAGNFWLHEPFLKYPTEEAKKMMDSHYVTLYNVLQSVLPMMIAKGGGKIMTFSCNATEFNLPNMVPFTAAKAAVDATIKCIAHEYAGDNIVANSIALSSLKTKKNKASRPHGDFDHYLDLATISDTVIEIAELSNHLANGNVIKCYEYSDSYYNEGYFQRIEQDQKTPA